MSRADDENSVQIHSADLSKLVYVSGHGGHITDGPYAGEYLLPVDTHYPDAAALAATAISGREFTTALSAIAARKAVVVFDCCHSAGAADTKDMLSPLLKTGLTHGLYDGLKAGRGRVILASSRASEFSYVMPGSEYTLFTQQTVVLRIWDDS